MAQLRTVRQDDFTGGLNLRADQFQLAPNESPKMFNVEIDPRGGVFLRGAMRRINTAGIAATWKPKNLFPFYGDSHYLMLSTGTSGATDGDVFYSTGSNFTSLAIPVGYKYGASFSPWGNKLFIACGPTKVSYKWDGTTASTLSSAGLANVWQNNYNTPTVSPEYFPQAAHTITHAGKVFVANTQENGVLRPNVVRWSHPNNPTNWASQDYIEINDGGQSITGLASFGGHLLVFKENAVFAIFGYDSDTFQVVEVSRSAGAPTPHAICTTERGVYFYSPANGLMFYNGNSIIDVFEPVRPAILNNDINSAAVEEVYVSYINRRIWVSLPYSEVALATTPTAVFVYDPTVSQRGAWLLFGLNGDKGVTGGCTFVSATGDTTHVAAHPSVAEVLEVDIQGNANDNIGGTNYSITSYYRTRWLDAGSYSQRKMFRRPDVVVKQADVASELTMDIYVDYEESVKTKSYDVSIPTAGAAMLWGTSYWGVAKWGAANVGSQIVNGRSIGLAKSIQVEFSGTAGVPWGINSFTLKYNPRKVTK